MFEAEDITIYVAAGVGDLEIPTYLVHVECEPRDAT
jgi:hypothetical protein